MHLYVHHFGFAGLRLPHWELCWVDTAFVLAPAVGGGGNVREEIVEVTFLSAQ